jgi:hypothetical protein
MRFLPRSINVALADARVSRAVERPHAPSNPVSAILSATL